MSDLPKFRELPEIELYKMRDGFQGWSPISAGAKVEIERRIFWKKFWTSGIVAWLALVVSIVALYVAIIVK